MLPAPVNSAHDEALPVLGQDREGRYLLAFCSDRNLARAHTVYVCWSDDLVNFSAPVQVTPAPGEPARVLQHTDGTYRLYLYALRVKRSGPSQLTGGDTWAVSVSEDLVHWSPSRAILPPSSGMDLLEDAGRYHALSTLPLRLGRLQQGRPPEVIHAHSSDDGLTFSLGKAVAVSDEGARRQQREPDKSPFQPFQVILRKSGGRILGLAFGRGDTGVVLAHAGAGDWKQVGEFWRRGVAWQLNHGDFAFDEKSVYYFALPRSAGLDEQITQRRSVAHLDPLGQPVYVFRHDYLPRAAPAEAPGPAQPLQARAHILRRYPAREAIWGPQKGK
jgi:hypothetical protein